MNALHTPCFVTAGGTSVGAHAPHLARCERRVRTVAVPRRVAAPRASAATDDKQQVTEYFNGTGFSRWARIYSDAADVNTVQADIRRGHAETVDTILGWLGDEAPGTTVLDAGCGVGSLTHPLGAKGLRVHGVDISAAMVGEARARAPEGSIATFAVGDVDGISESDAADVVCCVDVLIHYPTADAAAMITRLARLARRRIVVSFAPSTPFLVLLKKIGSFFPGASKATRAYLHREADVRAALRAAGFSVQRSQLCKTSFYFSTSLDAVRDK